MNAPFTFPSGEIDVTIYLIDGTTRSGRMRNFSPTTEVLLTTPPPPVTHAAKAQRPQGFPPERIACIALHRDPRIAVPTVPFEEAAEYDVRLRGDRSVSVRARKEDLEHSLGFVAWPLASEGLFSLYWFFRAGIQGVIDPRPIGQMLVDEGLLAETDLAEGLARQFAEKGVLLGQILAEQAGLDPARVEQAALTQPSLQQGRRALRLGELLVEAGLASPEDIDRALEAQRSRRGKKLGQVLVELGIVRENHISETLARKFSLPFVNLDTVGTDPMAIQEVPFDLVAKYGFLPIRSDALSLTVAIADPLAMEGIDMLRFRTRKVVREVVVTPSQLARRLDPLVGPLTAESVGTESGAVDEESSVVQLINQIIASSYYRGASDIHVEPNGRDREVQVRIRIDGECETAWRVPATQRSQLVARLKIMANLNIAEKRKPQDGKIVFPLGNRKIELRVASLPTVHGDEDVVMRILSAGEPLPMEKLGLSERGLDLIRSLVQEPHGLFLVVGPTGSGKTTTLHSLLRALNDDSRKILTAEDPVEITQAGLRQVQVNPRIGFDFATALRSFLRADPDVIMVGEIRDLETATIAIEASLTGHMVFSTLHTNSAAETVTRLVDMGTDAFMFSDALLGVLAQRLARRLCEQCRQAYVPSDDEKARVEHILGPERYRDLKDRGPLLLHRGAGCAACRDSGYKGRVGIHELLRNDEEIRAAIQQRRSVSEIRELAMRKGMRTLLQDGVEKALLGLTDLAQVASACGS